MIISDIVPSKVSKISEIIIWVRRRAVSEVVYVTIHGYLESGCAERDWWESFSEIPKEKCHRPDRGIHEP